VACGGFAAERHEGRRYLSTAAAAGRPAAVASQHGAQQQTQAASRWQMTLEAKHRLVFVENFVKK